MGQVNYDSVEELESLDQFPTEMEDIAKLAKVLYDTESITTILLVEALLKNAQFLDSKTRVLQQVIRDSVVQRTAALKQAEKQLIADRERRIQDLEDLPFEADEDGVHASLSLSKVRAELLKLFSYDNLKTSRWYYRIDRARGRVVRSGHG